MGREIVSISVPIGSKVWHQIQAWKADDDRNVSLAVCDCISEQAVLIDRIDKLRRKIIRIAKMTRKSPHIIDKDTWELELQGWCDK